MSEDLVSEIMKVEADASTIKTDAQTRAAEILSAAEEAAASIRRTAVADMQTRVEETLAHGKRVAESERSRSVAAVQQEMGALETQAAAHFEAAVVYVVSQIVGRGQVTGRW